MLDLGIVLEKLQRHPHTLTYVAGRAEAVRRRGRIDMDEAGRHPADADHIVRHIVVGHIRRDHIVARRVVVEPQPAYARKQRIEDSLVNMILDVGQVHKGARRPLEDLGDLFAALVLDDEELLRVAEGDGADDLAHHRVEPRDPHDVLGLQVADPIVKLEIIEIGQPLPLAHPVAVEAVQHLALALPVYKLLLIHSYPAYLYFGSSFPNRSRSRCPSPSGPSAFFRGRYT